jgi:purine-binding chemotaxis protein CheW
VGAAAAGNARNAVRTLVAFSVGQVEYAVHIFAVREVLAPGIPSPVPRPPLGVLGVVELRGEVVPVLDLRARFGLPPLHSKDTKWLLVDAGPSRIALVVDRVGGVFRAEVAEEKVAPPFLGDDELHKVLFVTKRQHALVFALDAEPFAQVAAGLSLDES